MNKIVISTISNSILEVEKEFDILQALRPTNLNSELERFNKEYKSGCIYNPVFKYDDNQKTYAKRELQRLSQILKMITEVSSPRIEFFLTEKIEDIFAYCRLASLIGDDDAFMCSSLDIFRETSINDVNDALNGISDQYNAKLEITSKVDLLTAEEFCAAAKPQLASISEQWSINTEQISAKVNVDCAKKVVQVNSQESFTKEEVSRLFVHEIWTHALRAENGSKQPIVIFQTGLAKSTSTEEGLAVFSEEINGLLDDRAVRLYCARVLACYLAQTKSFYEVYSAVCKIAPEDALHITHRVKRGMVNTCDPGGFLKDKLYYLGWKEVTRFFQNSSKLDQKLLYCGGIALHHISPVREALEEGELLGEYTLPPFFSKLNKNSSSKI
jgi:hypothetical protein